MFTHIKTNAGKFSSAFKVFDYPHNKMKDMPAQTTQASTLVLVVFKIVEVLKTRKKLMLNSISLYLRSLYLMTFIQK